MSDSTHRVVVLGGGFGGVYAAIALDRLRRRGAPIDVTLVNRENYLGSQPMLAEVVSGGVGVLDTISPLRRLARTHRFSSARSKPSTHDRSYRDPRAGTLTTRGARAPALCHHR